MFVARLKYIHFYLFSLFPMFILYLLSDLGYFILFYLVRYRRKVVQKNLKNSFPDKRGTELKKLEKAFYRHFCDLTFEIGKVLTAPKSWGLKHLKVTNPELLQKYHQQNRSVILFMGHYGNWEMFSYLPFISPFVLTAFYRPLSNKYFNDIVKSIRERFGGISIESNRGYKELMKFKQKGILTSTMIIGDQSPGNESSKYWTTFLNQETAFLVGADRIAKKSNQVLLYPDFRKTRRGFYDVEFLLISDNSKDLDSEIILEKFARLLEKSIFRDPSLWLWSHNRWKLSKEE